MWKALSSEMWSHVARKKFTDVSKDHTASIFRVECVRYLLVVCLAYFRSWSLICWWKSTAFHGVVSRKTVFYIATAVRISNPKISRNWRLSQLLRPIFFNSVIFYSVVSYVGNNISKKSATSILKIEECLYYPEEGGSWFPRNVCTIPAK
jgi:hypothetical protein